MNEGQVSTSDTIPTSVRNVSGCRHGVYFFRTGASRPELVIRRGTLNGSFYWKLPAAARPIVPERIDSLGPARPLNQRIRRPVSDHIILVEDAAIGLFRQGGDRTQRELDRMAQMRSLNVEIACGIGN